MLPIFPCQFCWIPSAGPASTGAKTYRCPNAPAHGTSRCLVCIVPIAEHGEAMQPLSGHGIPSISLSWVEQDVSPWPSAMPNLCLRTRTSAATSRGREGIFQTMTSIPPQHQETPLPMSINYYINVSIEPPLSLFNFLFVCYFGTGHSLISHLEHQKSYNYREEVRERALLPPQLSPDPSP